MISLQIITSTFLFSSWEKRFNQKFIAKNQKISSDSSSKCLSSAIDLSERITICSSINFVCLEFDDAFNETRSMNRASKILIRQFFFFLLSFFISSSSSILLNLLLCSLFQIFRETFTTDNSDFIRSINRSSFHDQTDSFVTSVRESKFEITSNDQTCFF
jgi:hypothetical protein